MMGNRMAVPKKLKLEQLPYEPVLLLLGIYGKEMKSLSLRDICTPLFTAAWFTVALRHGSNIPVSEWWEKN